MEWDLNPSMPKPFLLSLMLKEGGGGRKMSPNGSHISEIVQAPLSKFTIYYIRDEEDRLKN